MGWILRKWRWVNENRLFWWNLLFIAICFGVIYVWPAPAVSDFRIRTLGLTLQLIGVTTVWFDLTTTAREFGKGGVLRRTWRWLKAGFSRQQSVLVSGSQALALAGRARAKTRAILNPGSPLPDRVTNLEAVATQIDKDLDAAYAEIDTRATELDALVKMEAAERERAVSEVRRSLESATAGNYPMLLFGAVWLAVGIFLATWAPEIAKVAAGQCAEVWNSM